MPRNCHYGVAGKCRGVPRSCRGMSRNSRELPRSCQGIAGNYQGIAGKCQGNAGECQGVAKELPRNSRELPKSCQGVAGECQGTQQAFIWVERRSWPNLGTLFVFLPVYRGKKQKVFLPRTDRPWSTQHLFKPYCFPWRYLHSPAIPRQFPGNSLALPYI